MSEETPEEQSDENTPQKPLRGTASQPNPFKGESAPEGPTEDATVTIRAPDGSVREYRLTEDVKEGYEDFAEAKLEDACEWYDMWWEGTKLVIEYKGFIRDNDLRPDHENMTAEQIQQMLMSGQQPTMDGIPKKPNAGEQGQQPNPMSMMQGNMPSPNITIDLNERPGDDDDVNKLDEGVIPIWNKTIIDVQERADARPLQVEDLFIKPWSDEEGQMPLNSEHEDGEMDEEMFEVDFRDHTDDKDETVAENGRGDRWYL